VGGVRKGQNKQSGCGATEVVFWKVGRRTVIDDDGNEIEKSWMMMRFFNVFNIAQCEDHVIEYLRPTAGPNPGFSAIKEAERICAGYEIETRHGGDQAYYSPTEDRIQLPKPEVFRSSEHYYTTRFHEMGHSTGHANRLARDGITHFDFRGSHQYAEEELVAEFTACFLAGAAGFERTVEGSSAAYLKHWVARLKEDKKIIVRAAQRAQKASDLILGTVASLHAEETEEAA
jgi:antirestriction protein ArdC